MRHWVFALLVLVSLGSFGLFGLGEGGAETSASAKLEKLDFVKWYKPVPCSVAPLPVKYPGPLTADMLKPFEDRLKMAGVSPDDPLLLANGFVVGEGNKTTNLKFAYESLAGQKVPIFVTVDTTLHLFHVLFDKTLADIEETVLVPDLTKLITSMSPALEDLLASELKSAGISDPERIEPADTRLRGTHLALSYIKLVSALLAGVWKTDSPQVNRELELIRAHAGFGHSPLFGYAEDYSQYIPRGHYTKSEMLSRYFRAAMYMGRMVFLVNESDIADLDQVKSHTYAALLLAQQVNKPPHGETWKAIQAVSAFYCGVADDITMAEYLATLSEQGKAPDQIVEDASFREFQRAVSALPRPGIYSGTANIVKPLPLQEILRITTGMKLMGQAYILDGDAMGRMCYPEVKGYTGTGAPPVPGPGRGRGTSYDFMSVLGSVQARAFLAETQMDKFEGYQKAHDSQKALIAGLKERDWYRNLYMGTLDAIRSLLAAHSNRQPFQNNDAWEYRQLTSALGSWTALRHDTILYAKQPYGLSGGPGMIAPPKASGYVEPEPETFAGLAALAGMLKLGLEELGFLQRLGYETRDRIETMEIFSHHLLAICIRQLEQMPLDKAQNRFLEELPSLIKRIEGDEMRDFDPTIVADIMTGNDRKVVEVATGYFRTIAVVWALPDGRIDVALGPVYSWYEFLQPISNRLTDEKWREMLRDNPPAPPAWERHFVSGKGK